MPPLMAMVPLKPANLLVQTVCVNLPMAGSVSTVSLAALVVADGVGLMPLVKIASN